MRLKVDDLDNKPNIPDKRRINKENTQKLLEKTEKYLKE